jgi:hypothetical protein
MTAARHNRMADFGELSTAWKLWMRSTDVVAP